MCNTVMLYIGKDMDIFNGRDDAIIVKCDYFYHKQQEKPIWRTAYTRANDKNDIIRATNDVVELIIRDMRHLGCKPHQLVRIWHNDEGYRLNGIMRCDITISDGYEYDKEVLRGKILEYVSEL